MDAIIADKAERRPAHSRIRRIAPRLAGPAVVASLAALLWMVLRWHRPDHLIGFIDLFPIYKPLILLRKTGLAWSHVPSPFGGFDLPTYSSYYLLNWFLSALAGPSFAELGLFWLMLASGWLGVFALCRSLRVGVAGSLLAAWFYTLGPYAQFLLGFITAAAFAGLLPWAFWMIREAAARPRRRRAMTAIAATTSLLILPWIGSTPQLLFEFLLLTVLWSAFLAPRSRPGFLQWFCLTTTVCSATAAWWIVPVIVALFSNGIGHPTAPSSVAWTFAHSSLLNNLRFINPWTWGDPNYIPYSNGYDANVATYAAGFWGVVLLCVALLFRRSAHASFIRFFALVTVAAIFLAKGLHPPLAYLNSLVYELPGFFLLIEPVGLTIGALLSLSVVAGIVIATLQRARWGVQLRLVALAAASAATLCASLLAASPLLNGLVFSAPKDGYADYVRLPDYWKRAAQYLNSAAGSGSVLVLPADAWYQERYAWGYEGVDVMPAQLIARDVLLMGASLDYFVDPKLESIKRRLSGMLLASDPSTAAALRALGIRFVLCRFDVPAGFSFHSDPCHAAFLRRYARTRTFGALEIYDLGRPAPEFSYSGPDRDRLTVRSAGIASVLTVPASGTLIYRQFCHPTWLALGLGLPPTFLQRACTRDGFNAWRLRAAGTAVVFNAVDAAELALAALGLSVVTLCWLLPAGPRRRDAEPAPSSLPPAA